MELFRNIPLKKYNTFGLDYMADCMIHVRTAREAISVFNDEILWEKPLLVMGGGSNILFVDHFKGTILIPALEEIHVEEQNPEYVIISAGAGINWDKFVEWTVNNGYCGLENLSLIPGMVGATPVQNIGAYGVEVKDKIEKVHAVCINDGKFRVFNKEECGFEYRSSVFKKILKGKYLITRVYYKLEIKPVFDLEYGSLRDEINKLGDLTIRNVRQTVINIRSSKLPDPVIVGNAGSFFKNPVVSNVTAEDLSRRYPLVPKHEDNSGTVKLAAGWLIDQCGWRGWRKGDAGVHEKQALVLVNHGRATGREIYGLSEEIRKSVFEKFGIDLEREVEIVGAI